jgi:hypothetical protein
MKLTVAMTRANVPLKSLVALSILEIPVSEFE